MRDSNRPGTFEVTADQDSGSAGQNHETHDARNDSPDPEVQELIQKAVDKVYTGILIIRFQKGNDFDILWTNERLQVWQQEYLKSHKQTPSSPSIKDFFFEDDFDLFRKGYCFFIENPGKPFRMIHHRPDVRGKDLWLFVNATVIEYDTEMRPDIVVVTITDLTCEIESEIRLNSLLEQNFKVKEKYKAVELTKRQVEVLRLITDGYTNKEIAFELNISPHTVDTHRKKLLAKFNIKNSATLVRLSMELGLQ